MQLLENMVSLIKKIDEEFARIGRSNIYVDDLSCGVNNVEEGFDLCKKNEVSIRQSMMKLYVNSCKNVKIVIIQDRKLIK